MELRERAERVQRPMVKALVDPRLTLLPHDARVALAELVSFLGELVAEIEIMKGKPNGKS